MKVEKIQYSLIIIILILTHCITLASPLTSVAAETLGLTIYNNSRSTLNSMKVTEQINPVGDTIITSTYPSGYLGVPFNYTVAANSAMTRYFEIYNNIGEQPMFSGALSFNFSVNFGEHETSSLNISKEIAFNHNGTLQAFSGVYRTADKVCHLITAPLLPPYPNNGSIGQSNITLKCFGVA